MALGGLLTAVFITYAVLYGVNGDCCGPDPAASCENARYCELGTFLNACVCECEEGWTGDECEQAIPSTINITILMHKLPRNQCCTNDTDEETICSEMDKIFIIDPWGENPLKQRYNNCTIHSFLQGSKDIETPDTITFSLVFDGPKSVCKIEIDEIISTKGQKFEFSEFDTWLLIGARLLIKAVASEAEEAFKFFN